MTRVLTGGGFADAEGATWGPSRRASYYGGSKPPLSFRQRHHTYMGCADGSGGRFTQDSYYGSRPPSMMYSNRAEGSMPDLRTGGMGQRDNYYDQQPGYGSYGSSGQNGRRGWSRMSSEPQYGSGPGLRQPNPNEYPMGNNHRSYETVTTASGSGSSGDQAGYQTDPTSSDNSSIERVQTALKRQAEPANDYGIGFGQSPSYQAPSFTVGIPGAGLDGRDQYQTNGAPSYGGPSNGASNYGNPNYGGPPYGGTSPPVPRKDSGAPMLRKPLANNRLQQQQRPAQPEKRKSWFSRRFSKNG